MKLKSERLILRPFRISDAKALFYYACDPAVGPPAGWAPHVSVDESREIIRTRLTAPHTFAVCLVGTDEPIGCIGLHREDLAEDDDELELGYWLGRPFWGRGLITEAGREVLRYAFLSLGMRRVWCGHYEGNTRSRRVMEKLGFLYHHTTEGIELPRLGETRRGHAFLLTRNDWEKQNAKEQND